MIYAIGRNYALHAKELGNNVPTHPVVFFKPIAGMVASGQKVRLPQFSNNVHFEVELAFRFNEKLEPGDIAISIDLTARDKQKEAQEAKGPWALAKGFINSTQIGPWVSAKGIDLQNLELKLLLNGELKQKGNTKDMVFNIPSLIKYLKDHFPIRPGDIVLTGTPSGVGPVKSGDKIEAEIVGLTQAQWLYE